jgi:hypothetical protein
MIPQFQHKLSTSYLLWFENYFFKKSKAYTQHTGQFTFYKEDRLPDGYHPYGVPFKQLMYDSSLPDVYIPSGLYVNGEFVEFDQENYFMDFENGRFIGNDTPTGAAITGAYTAKDINIYYTNDTEENIVLNVQESIDKSVNNIHSSFYDPYQQKIPAIYISNQASQNKPFAFGGMNETITQGKAVIITYNSFELDVATSIFADSFNENIPMVDFYSHPLNDYGALKTGYYSYGDIQRTTSADLFVKSVQTSKMSDRMKNNMIKFLYIGFVDFELSMFRYRS